MELNRFMLEGTSICPETTHQKLVTACYLTPLTVDLYVIFLSEDCGGVASTTCILEKLCKLRCLFLYIDVHSVEPSGL